MSPEPPSLAEEPSAFGMCPYDMAPDPCDLSHKWCPYDNVGQCFLFGLSQTGPMGIALQPSACQHNPPPGLTPDGGPLTLKPVQCREH